MHNHIHTSSTLAYYLQRYAYFPVYFETLTPFTKTYTSSAIHYQNQIKGKVQKSKRQVKH